MPLSLSSINFSEANFNAVYFRASMKPTSMVNGSVGPQPTERDSGAPLLVQESFSYPASPTAQPWLPPIKLHISVSTASSENRRNVAAAFDFRPSFPFSMKEVVIYRREIQKSK